MQRIGAHGAVRKLNKAEDGGGQIPAAAVERTCCKLLPDPWKQHPEHQKWSVSCGPQPLQRKPFPAAKNRSLKCPFKPCSRIGTKPEKNFERPAAANSRHSRNQSTPESLRSFPPSAVCRPLTRCPLLRASRLLQHPVPGNMCKTRKGRGMQTSGTWRKGRLAKAASSKPAQTG